MKLKFNKKSSTRLKSRAKNKVRVRKKISGDSERPRLAVYRSTSHTYAQAIDDVKGHTLASVSTLKASGPCGSMSGAKSVGEQIAKILKDKKIDKIVFDRSGYLYHGRVKAVADGAREAGLIF